MTCGAQRTGGGTPSDYHREGYSATIGNDFDPLDVTLATNFHATGADGRALQPDQDGVTHLERGGEIVMDPCPTADYVCVLPVDHASLHSCACGTAFTCSPTCTAGQVQTRAGATSVTKPGP